MNTETNSHSRRDEIVTAIGVLALILGTATGDAVTMLIIAVVSLAVVSLIYLRNMGIRLFLLAFVAASIAFTVAMGISTL